MQAAFEMEKRTLSIGFADMTQYAKVVELIGSEAAAGLVQEAFQTAGDSIVSLGGTIRKYIGDAILFSFEDPRQAVRAAREIAAGFRRSVGPMTVRYHVAVATGEVLVGELGHPSLRLVDVMGQTVNRAARLLREAHASESGCAFCEETARHLA